MRAYSERRTPHAIRQSAGRASGDRIAKAPAAWRRHMTSYEHAIRPSTWETRLRTQLCTHTLVYTDVREQQHGNARHHLLRDVVQPTRAYVCCDRSRETLRRSCTLRTPIGAFAALDWPALVRSSGSLCVR